MKAPHVNEPPLAARVRALDEAADLGAGRSSEAAVGEAKRVTRQVDRRLAFAGDWTVVALAGTTGSGKSSLFNAISGTQLARSSVRRPTTAATMAASWGEVPTDLLRWLDVSERHTIGDGDPRFDGLVLLDLPDHDSTATSHRDEVDRLVRLVDGMIWVLDPQKYADYTLHENYLKPLAPYADVMLIVLNQADKLPPADLQAALTDLRALLAADGLGKAQVVATSALTGAGIDDLRGRLAERVAGKRTAAARLSADVGQAAGALLADVTRQHRRIVSDDARARLLASLDKAAGVPDVVAGVDQATRQRGALATGWPLVSWINKLKPDPIKRLRAAPAGQVRPQGATGAVAMAQVDTALRQLGDEVTAGLPSGWASAVRTAATGQRANLPAALDAGLDQADLGVDQQPGWWRFVRVVQWVLIGVVVAGIVWAVIAGMATFAAPAWHGIRWPAIVIVLGVVLGVAVALVCHAAVAVAARRRAARASLAMRAQVAQVADQQVVRPVTAELQRYASFVAAVARAL